MIAALLMMLPVSGLAGGFDVYVLGEIHDNPAHHIEQARRIAEIKPDEIVFEMLTDAQAARVTPELLDDAEALAKSLGWAESGWPDFAIYYPVFVAAPQARLIGAAVPRKQARNVMSQGAAEVFGADAERYGLTEPLPRAEQTARETLQKEAHCNALPEEMLPMMVNIQRLRDAALARGVVRATEISDGPIVVITGNGHARRDWGVPAVLARVAPDLRVFVLGQGEEGRLPPEGGFDALVSAAPVERQDPCDAFK